MRNKKQLTIVIACYNEKDNVIPLVESIFNITNNSLSNYNVVIQFIDNCSIDGTRDNLRILCSKYKNVRAILNAKNFGHIRSPFYGLKEADGDLIMLMCADFQDPPELIPEFVKKYEEGYKVIVGTKKKSKTNPILHLVRRFYYFLIRHFSEVPQIENFTGFGLYDKEFIKIITSLDNPYPYMRGLVAEYGNNIYEFEYEQPKRRFGKTHNNFYTLYDMAMNGFTSYSKILARSATFVGIILGLLSFIGFIVYFVFLGIKWNSIHPSIVYPITCTIGIIGAIILFFVGMVGEYVLRINTMVTKRPLVIEEERINFNNENR